MKKFNLTIKRKLLIYKYALTLIENDKEKFMCIAIKDAITAIFNIDKIDQLKLNILVSLNKDKYKEFWKHEPKLKFNQSLNTSVWFNDIYRTPIEHKQFRVDIFNSIIKELTDKLN